MEHLWAPWRTEYVKNQTTKDLSTMFAEIGSDLQNDEENFVLLRGKGCFVILNRYPYNLGHLMVVPFRAVPDLVDLNAEEETELWALAKQMTLLLRKTFSPHGFNIGVNIGAAAGAGVPGHLHLHVVPRWEHDSNFITTVADTRIHPSDLKTVYGRLKKTLAAEFGG